jgi:hypothetical protein
VLLVGITYVGVDGCVIAQQQFFGEAVSVHPREGILLSLRGQRLGEQYNLPPDTRAVKAAARGEYRLCTTGEVVADPDYTVTFSLTKQKDVFPKKSPYVSVIRSKPCHVA